MTDQQPYTVEREYSDFEIRAYPPHVLVQVDSAGTFFEAGNRGFRPLISYISGNNIGARRIAMTAPVIQSPQSATEHTVSFVLPEGMDVASVPVPADARVRTVAVAASRVAARKFSGGSSESLYESNATKLIAGLAREAIATTGDAYFARFDPPWKPGFLKHNEVLIALEKP